MTSQLSNFPIFLIPATTLATYVVSADNNSR